MRFICHCLDFNFRRNWEISFGFRYFLEDYFNHVRSYWYEGDPE